MKILKVHGSKKPVAFIVDTDTFESFPGSSGRKRKELINDREESLKRIAILRNRISTRTEAQTDSTLIIRELRQHPTDV